MSSSLFANIASGNGATPITIIFIILLAIMLLVQITNLPMVALLHKGLGLLKTGFGKFIHKREDNYHRDLEIGKINEKRTKVKLYKFLSELIIDLNLYSTGILPYELLTMVVIIVAVVVTVICKILFGSITMTFIMTPIAIIATFCVMYTKANVAHDARIESVIDAENIICNNIKIGVVAAVKDSINVIPKNIRPAFRDFIDNVEQKNYHIKTALLELNQQLGSVADDFIKKCIVFELEEEHGIANMFQDVVEINNINMEFRTDMKRSFEEVKTQFVTGVSMILVFLFGVIAIYDVVRNFYFKTAIGNAILAADALIIVIEFMYITYLRAKEL